MMTMTLCHTQREMLRLDDVQIIFEVELAISDKDVLCALDGFGFGRLDAKNEDENAFVLCRRQEGFKVYFGVNHQHELRGDLLRKLNLTKKQDKSKLSTQHNQLFYIYIIKQLHFSDKGLTRLTGHSHHTVGSLIEFSNRVLDSEAYSSSTNSTNWLNKLFV